MDAGDIWSSTHFKMRFASKASIYRREVTEAAMGVISDTVRKFQTAGFRPEPLDYSNPDVKGTLRPSMIGDSPQVYTLGSQKVVGAGQKKTGVYWVLAADTITLKNNIQAVPSWKDSLGLFADSAISGDLVFVNGVNCEFQANPPLIPPTGEVIALNSDASGKVWEFLVRNPIASVLSGVAVANGVVYFHTSAPQSSLYALDAMSGALLTPLPGVLTDGGISGPSVSNGQIYVGTGTLFASGVPTLSGFTGIVAIGL